MAEIKMGVVESHFADIIWANEPLHSRDLVKLCEKELNWNRSTTYTVDVYKRQHQYSSKSFINIVLV